MKVAIRTDASARIGTGHVWRSIALAEAISELGGEVRFISRELEGHLLDTALKECSVVRLPPPRGETASDLLHESWLGERWEEDADQTVAALRGIPPEWVVVDHYGIDERWESRVRGLGVRIAVVDDLGDRRHDADLLVDATVLDGSSAAYKRLVPTHCELLLGPRYALLRKEITARPSPDRRGTRDPHVVVYLGSDRVGATRKAIDALAELPYRVTVVIGPGNPDYIALRQRISRLPHITRQRPGRQFGRLLRNADLFVGAGGVTTWERCYLGVPSVVISVADNQDRVSEGVARSGAAVYLGRAEDVSIEMIRAATATLMGSPSLVSHLSEMSRQLVDGRGALRVASRLVERSVLLRRASAADSEMVHAWRNDPRVRHTSFHRKPISLARHRRWFASAITDPRRQLLIAEAEQGPVGVLRFDLAEDEAEVSIFVAPDLQGAGWGRKILVAGTDWIREHSQQTTRLVAKVRADNEASRSAFLAAGYVENHFVYQLELDGARSGTSSA